MPPETMLCPWKLHMIAPKPPMFKRLSRHQAGNLETDIPKRAEGDYVVDLELRSNLKVL